MVMITLILFTKISRSFVSTTNDKLTDFTQLLASDLQATTSSH